ncbi:hypothetical protein C8Q80DRAFT_474763 [Daedaleopsis nitida]|nr:hypothetical protein C8Q80DRAFT_474763 [Daedaleopsis nitida]
MLNGHHHAILAAFLPLLPLLFSDDATKPANDWAHTMPNAARPPDGRVDAHSLSTPPRYEQSAQGLDRSLSPEWLANVTSGPLDDTLPVMDALRAIHTSLFAHMSATHLVAILLAITSSAMVLYIGFSMRSVQPLPPLEASDSSPGGDHLSQLDEDVFDAHQQAGPRAQPQLFSALAHPDTKVSSPNMSFPTLSSPILPEAGTPPASSSSSPIRLRSCAPPPASPPLTLSQLFAAVAAMGVPLPVNREASLERQNDTLHAPALGAVADQIPDMIPERSSWSLDKAYEEAPYDNSSTPRSGSPERFAAASVPQSQLPAEQEEYFRRTHLADRNSHETHNVDIFQDMCRGRVLSDITEHTEPESDCDGPSTPRARWFSGIHKSLASLDNYGLTFGVRDATSSVSPCSSPDLPSHQLPATSCPFTEVRRIQEQAPSDVNTVLGTMPLDVPSDVDGDVDDTEQNLLCSTSSQTVGVSDAHPDMPHNLGMDGSVLSMGSCSSWSLVESPSGGLILDEVTELCSSATDCSVTSDCSQVDPPCLQEDMDSDPQATVSTSSTTPSLVDTPTRGRTQDRAPLSSSVSPALIHEAAPTEADATMAASTPASHSSPRLTRSFSVPRSFGSRARRPSKALIARSGLFGKQVSLTATGIDYVAERATEAAGDRRQMSGIVTDAMDIHGARSLLPRSVEEVLLERRMSVEPIPARVDRDIIDGAQNPPLEHDSQIRRVVFEVSRSRSSVLGRKAQKTSRVKLEPAQQSSACASQTSLTRPTLRRSASQPVPIRHQEKQRPSAVNQTGLGDEAPPHTTPLSYASVAARPATDPPALERRASVSDLPSLPATLSTSQKQGGGDEHGWRTRSRCARKPSSSASSSTSFGETRRNFLVERKGDSQVHSTSASGNARKDENDQPLPKRTFASNFSYKGSILSNSQGLQLRDLAAKAQAVGKKSGMISSRPTGPLDGGSAAGSSGSGQPGGKPACALRLPGRFDGVNDFSDSAHKLAPPLQKLVAKAKAALKRSVPDASTSPSAAGARSSLLLPRDPALASSHEYASRQHPSDPSSIRNPPTSRRPVFEGKARERRSTAPPMLMSPPRHGQSWRSLRT